VAARVRTRAGGGRGLIQADGAKQLRRSLKQAGLDVSDLKAAHKAVAELIASRSAPNAPRRSGALAASVRPAGTAREAVVRAGRARVPYAGPVHWGWKRPAGPGRRAQNIPAQPWLYAAARANEDPALDLYLRALERIIDTIEGAHP